MCNAWTHYPDCNCGFGGWTGYWISPTGARRRYCEYIEWAPKRSFEFSAGQKYSFESFLNPNANCPVCGAPVFFYQSPYGGRVFFDELGPPWPKHPCMDLTRRPGKGTALTRFRRGSKRINPPEWQKSGWEPLSSVFIRKQKGKFNLLLTGYGLTSKRKISIGIRISSEITAKAPILVKPVLGCLALLRVSFVIPGDSGLEGDVGCVTGYKHHFLLSMSRADRKRYLNIQKIMRSNAFLRGRL